MIIPVRDEAAWIERCLAAVLSGSTVPDEVMVIDGGSTDRTREIVEDLAGREPRVRLVGNPRRNAPSALNLGCQHSRSSLVLRVDGHAVISPEYVATAVRHLRDGEWQGVGGRKDPVASTSTGRAVAAAMSSRWGVGNSRYHYATGPEEAEHVPFGAYPRHVIERLGGWDESLSVNQDFEFDHRLRQAGGRILFDPAMTSAWACSASLRDLAHQYLRYGRGKVAVAGLHPGSLRARHVVPPLLPVVLAASLVASITVAPTAALVPVGYLAAMGTSVGAGPRPLPWAIRARLPLVLVVMHNAWGVGFLSGVVGRVLRRPGRDPYRRRDLGLADTSRHGSG